MAWYQLTTDVMVQGTPRSFGEVLDLNANDGQLLVGLGRAKPCDAKPAEPACPMPAAPVDAAPEPHVKPVARRRSTSPLPKD
jgi:hypothetical protein